MKMVDFISVELIFQRPVVDVKCRLISEGTYFQKKNASLKSSSWHNVAKWPPWTLLLVN